jgi:hypothetical protein
MGNAQSQSIKKTYCSDYKHSDIVNAIYTVLSRYQIEAMCDCASWLLRELLLHKKYNTTQVDLICSTVNNSNHVFVFDKLEHYYIDITSEQFVDTKGEQIEPCIGSKTIEVFEELGYEISGENTNEVCKTFCKQSCVLYDKGNPITRIQLLNEIKKHLGMKGGKRKKRKTKRII